MPDEESNKRSELGEALARSGDPCAAHVSQFRNWMQQSDTMPGMELDALLERLGDIVALRRLPVGDLDRLVSQSILERFDPGQVLMDVGAPARDAWLLLEGRASIRVLLSPDEERVIASRRPGDWLGEMGLLDPGPRSARVVAETPGVALRIPGQAFLEAVAGAPAALDLLRSMIARVRDSDAAQIELLRAKNETLERVNSSLRSSLAERAFEDVFVGSSGPARAVREAITAVARSDQPVLLVGETGTGKELLARQAHTLSQQAGAFVPVNCALLSGELLESALFGHNRGAFTGALAAKQGLVESADGGTLFLDELCDTPPRVQAALLRFLESGEFRRVGETQLRRADLRLVAATQLDPDEAVRQGRLRPDLRFRIDVLSVRVPPLRERREDIPEIAQHLASVAARRLGLPPLHLSRGVLEVLVESDYPGNVRELRNAIERLYVRRPPDASTHPPMRAPGWASCYSEALRGFKTRLVREALDEARGNVTQAARRLGLHRAQLYRLMRALGLTEGGRPGPGLR